jgi:hypothetical protein
VSVVGGALKLTMHGGEALASLGTVQAGDPYVPVLTGDVLPGSGFETFRAPCPIAIARVSLTPSVGCGVGPELALIVPVLSLLYARRRSARVEVSR